MASVPGGHHSSAPLSTLSTKHAQGCHDFVPNVCQLTEPTPDPFPAREHRRHLARSTAVFGIATGVSRVLGLAREIVAAYAFGAGGRINAFTIAFAIPNLVRALVADSALSGAFVPVFSELLEKGERVRAWRVASTILWLILLITGAMTALFILIAPLVIGLFGNPGGDVDLAVTLSRILFPIVVLLGLSGVVVGVLNSYDHFTIPALTPVAWNLVIILGLAIGIPTANGDEAELYWYAGSIVVATFVQLLLPLPWLRGLDGRFRLAFDWRDPAVRKFLALMLPVTLALGLININTLIGMAFASRLIDPELAPRAIDLAFRLYMLPQGIFSVAVATVLFPTLSRLAARGDMRGFGGTLDTGLRQIGFLLIPAGVVSAVLAEPIVRLVYERGAFTPDQTPVVAGALAAFSVGLVFNGWMLMLNRAYYGLQSNWVPTLVALGNLALNALLDLALYRVGVWGIPLATSIANLVGAAALLLLLRPRVEGVDERATVGALAKIVVASVLVAAAAYGVWWLLDDLLGRALLAQIASVGIGLAAAAAAYVLAGRVLKIRELGALRTLVRRSP
jgi:putative peptidoglycan lipid II flippase